MFNYRFENDGVDFHSPLSVHSEMLIIVGNKRYVFINESDTNNGIFINEDGKLSMGVDDCGFLFANEIRKEDVAQMIVEHLFYVEGEFIPLDD